MFQPSPPRARPSRSSLPALGLLLALGCAACARGDAAAPIPPPAPDFDAGRAWSDLETIVGFGPRPAGSRRLEKLREWLEAELSAAGLDPEREAFTAETPIGALELANVVAELPAAASSGEDTPIVVVAAHVDTKRLDFPFVGANDGGSGTAALLEIARAMAARGPGAVRWRFVFLDGEEAVRPFWEDPDNRYGSRHHVERLRETGLLPRVAACVVLDLVADRDLRFTTERNSDPRILGILFDAARDIGLGRHVGARPQEIADDHVSFLDAGVPSAVLIDFEYGSGNAYWHSPDDTLENCSKESLEAAGRIALAGLAALEAEIAR